ncbi:alpha/beta-hydrolase [Cylindrobasidium torrendii FP15055 ss-10]|uniref:Alpha/beta-hydrolase n=1 Tax=Cylindrobasidium torrendii FP15055 ss-10 TaxID=1314674 RepID=A0A0D7AUH4_9AGAR|nr:alpha/beta-hydrolase [Cylindrobasidium torrendii FP15055 ss-10]
MPTITVQTPTGTVNFFYTISTPTETHAESIDKDIPTVLFLHSVYNGQEIFELQWEEPRIRRFNCVGIDMREHGYTTGDKVPEGYGQKDAADDIALVMQALKILTFHIVGQSMGTIVGLALAVYYPETVLSLCLVSPLVLEETPDVVEGRAEIAEYWKQGFTDGTKIDVSALQDAVYGAMQFALNNRMDSFSNALINRTYPLIVEAWSKKNFDIYDRMMGDFSNNRREYTDAELARISVPVKLIHGRDDIAYPVERTQTLLGRLLNAGVNASFIDIPDAPHWVCTYTASAPRVNEIIADFLEHTCKGTAPPIPAQAVSPWEADLIKAGWEREEDD